MSHDNLEDLMMQAEELGVRDKVLTLCSKLRSESGMTLYDALQQAFDEITNKNDTGKY